MKRGIIESLKEMANSKNDTYAILAKELLGRKDHGPIKMRELQENCHVSSTTVFRFCKELGISGFSELKFLLSQAGDQEEKIKLKEQSVLTRKTDSHLDKIVLSLVETRDLLQENVLQEIVKLLKDVHQVNLYASGSTYLVAKDFELKLDRVKIFAKAYQDANLQYFAAKNSGLGTLGIGITYSGKTEWVLKSLRIAREQGAVTLLITNVANQQFEGEFDYILYVGATDMRHRLVTTTARLSLLYVLDLIYYSYVNDNLEAVNEILLNNKLFEE